MLNQAQARRYVRAQLIKVLEEQTDTSARGRQAVRDEPAVQEVWMSEVERCIERLQRLNK